MFSSPAKQIIGTRLRKIKEAMRGGTRGMMQTHVEYDDFGEYVETIDLMPITASQAGQQDGSRLAGDQNLVLAS